MFSTPLVSTHYMPTVPSKLWKSKISPDIADCHQRENHALLRTIVCKVNVHNYVVQNSDVNICVHVFNLSVLCVRILEDKGTEAKRTFFNFVHNLQCEYWILCSYLPSPCADLTKNGCRFAPFCSRNRQEWETAFIAAAFCTGGRFRLVVPQASPELHTRRL